MNLTICGKKTKVILSLLTLSALFAAFAHFAQAQEPGRAKTEGDKGVVQPAIAYSAEKLRDPFSSSIENEMLANPVTDTPAVADTPLPPMKVQGIFWGGKFPQAIINDKIVKVGDKIEGAQIVSIEKDLIRIFFINREFSLYSPASENLASSFNKKDAKKEEIDER